LANYAECRNPELERAQDTLRKVVLSTIAELELAKQDEVEGEILAPPPDDA
jgi:hypothetical protein